MKSSSTNRKNPTNNYLLTMIAIQINLISPCKRTNKMEWRTKTMMNKMIRTMMKINSPHPR